MSQSIPSQSGDLGVALPIVIGQLNNQAALNAAAEVTVSVPLSRAVSFPVLLGWVAVACVNPAAFEANVMYVAAVLGWGGQSAGLFGSVSVKVKNVGSVNSAQTWNVYLIAIPIGAA